MNQSRKIEYLLEHITALSARDSDQILLEQLGVGYSQYKILVLLDTELKVTQRFIANSLGQTEPSVTRQIGILLDGGLINKQINSINKKERLISVTEKGLKILRACEAILSRQYDNAFTGLDEKQLIELKKLLTQIHETICNNPHFTTPDI